MRHVPELLLPFLLAACGPDVSMSKQVFDQDSDGYSSDVDCDDGHATVHPDADEVCDGLDNDCDGDVDEDALDAGIYAIDADGDGHGNPSRTTTGCEAPEGWVAGASDCDDTDPAIHPGAVEVCDAADVDEDCDGAADDADPGVDPSSAATWTRDADADGYGAEGGLTVEQCDPPAGYAAVGGDCDDADSAVHPGATERCDPDDVDEDCDGVADDGDASTSAASFSTWYRDADADGFGDPARSVTQCDAPSGYTADDRDCDDGAASVSPDAEEVCNTLDDDCDALADDADSSVTGTSTWYADADGDGFGDAGAAVVACFAPVGHVPDGTDCHDGDASAFPGAEDPCEDGVDQDCSGTDEVCPLVGIDGPWDVEIHGTAANSGFGASLVGGDFDGDGLGDLVVGAPDDTTFTTTETGFVYGYQAPFVPGVQAATDHDAFAYHSGEYWLAGFGTGVWTLGDLDGDGRDDLAVLGDQPAGVMIFHGGDGGTSGYATVYDAYCTQCSNATVVGDVAGGVDWACGDLRRPTTSRGDVLVYTSGSSRAVATLEGEATGDAPGRTVATGHDRDGDGTDDLWIGADGVDAGGSGAGAAYLVYGPVAGTSSLASADAKIVGDAASDGLGYGCSLPGDVDGDGAPDLVSAAPGADDGGADAGAVYLFTSVASGPASATAQAIFLGEGAGDGLGGGGLAFGDFDGDGEIDLALGSATHDGGSTDAGGAWVFYGPFSGTYSVGSADVTWRGGYAADGLGQALATIPDGDGDGRDELAIGARWGDSDTLADHGVTWIWSGG